MTENRRKAVVRDVRLKLDNVVGRGISNSAELVRLPTVAHDMRLDLSCNKVAEPQFRHPLLNPQRQPRVTSRIAQGNPTALQ